MEFVTGITRVTRTEDCILQRYVLVNLPVSLRSLSFTSLLLIYLFYCCLTDHAQEKFDLYEGDQHYGGTISPLVNVTKPQTHHIHY